MAYRGGGRGGPMARPENALKRADELENVGQKHAALQALHDVVTSRKRNQTWSKTYEAIMFKHIDLVVEMKKRIYAKEALMQYRNMCQLVNINSLEEVIKYFLKKAMDKAEEAQGKAAAVTLDVEDLDADASPEDLMLSYVSVEKGRDRTDREMVTPWFRFLWEAYRSVLEILRTNPKLESLYAMTAVKAFQFCQQYKRTAEFRRLGDILRQHQLNMVNRYRDNRGVVIMEGYAESLQLHLETRFEQLKVACELELWGEAFRSVEDIQGLITMGKRAPKQQLMATYYARLTQIFAKSEGHLHHAYAWLKLFNFSKTYNKNMTQADLQQMACSVLLASLSILPYDRSMLPGQQDELLEVQEKERTIRMANILGFAVDQKRDYRNVLSRGALLGSIHALNILSMVPPEVRQIYELLTQDFNPLELCERLSPLLAKLQDFQQPLSAASPVRDVSLTYYVPLLKQVAVLRLLKQLSEAYSALKIQSLAAMVPFVTFSEVEAIIVDAVKYEYLQVRLDHRNGTLHFGSMQLESERISMHLALLSKRLSKAVSMIVPSESEERTKRHAQAVQSALENMEKEHSRANARKLLIEKRKEQQELELLEAEKEEALRRAQQQREAEQAEEKRRREDMLRREKERIERELEEREMEEARAMLEAAKKKGTGKAIAGMKEGEKLDKKAIMQEALTERIKEQQEMERKMAKMAKQLDHLERARREEEVPFIEDAFQKRLQLDKQLHEEQQTAFLAAHRTAWETDLAEKQRLLPMLADKESFQAQIMSRRQTEFEELRKQRERRRQERRQQRKVERQVARRRAFVQRCQDQVHDRIQELEEEQRREEERRQKEEEAERMRKLEEAAEKMRKREAELEVKAREERERLLASGPARPAAGAAAASSSGGGGGYVPPSRRGAVGAGAAPPPARDDDRWGRSAPPAAAADRDFPPRPAPEGDRWGRSAPAADGGGGGSAAAPSAGGGSKFVPPALRRAQQGGDDSPPPPSRDTAPPRPAAAPPSGGGGGAYRPPGRR